MNRPRMIFHFPPPYEYVPLWYVYEGMALIGMTLIHCAALMFDVPHADMGIVYGEPPIEPPPITPEEAAAWEASYSRELAIEMAVRHFDADKWNQPEPMDD